MIRRLEWTVSLRITTIVGDTKTATHTYTRMHVHTHALWLMTLTIPN